MAFYEQISKYYDYIFPTSKEKYEFLIDTIGRPPKGVVDVACGNGGYSIMLSKAGYRVTAIDLDTKMIEETKKKQFDEALDLNVIEGNMLEINQVLDDGYDAIFCIGNSLVHLDSLEEINQFFHSVYELLNPGGKVMIQIINYDRILENNIHYLPKIKNDVVGLSFDRFYRIQESKNKILFDTILKVNDEVYENTIPLIPLKHDALINILKQNHFKNIEVFGDFKKSNYEKLKSYALVLRAVK